MSANHLEQLLSEWYEYQGYFIRRNILVEPRSRGGYESELDIVGFHPGEPDKPDGKKPHLIHIETSLDADSWEVREARFQRKFGLGSQQIPVIFRGFNIPKDIEKIAVLVFASKQKHTTIGGGRIVLASEVLEEIFRELNGKRLESKAVPEHLLILRSFQYVSQYRDAVMKVWKS